MTAERSAEAGLRRSDWALAAAICALIFGIAGLFRQDRDWNSASRLLLSYAIAERGTVEISNYVASQGKLLTDPATRDLSSPRPGEFYCDKAPGHSFLGAVACWFVRLWMNTPTYPVATPVMRSWPLDVWLVWLVNGLALAGTAGLVFFGARLVGAGAVAAVLAALSFSLATNALPYATVFYGHGTAGFFATACIVGAWLARNASRWQEGWSAFAGVMAGAAVVTEYTLSILPVVVSSSLLLSSVASSADRRTRLRALAAFLAGGLPMAALLGWYHWSVTGSPWTPPYKYEVEAAFAYHREGAGIPIGVPDPTVMAQLLFGPRRGMLWFAPAALMGAVGCVAMIWLPRGRALAVEALLLWAGLVVIAAGFPTWDGGFASGPRFLLPCFGPLCIGLAALTARPGPAAVHWIARLAWGTCIVLGFAFALGCTVVGVAIPPNVERPHEFIWRNLDAPAGNVRFADPSAGAASRWTRGQAATLVVLVAGVGALGLVGAAHFLGRSRAKLDGAGIPR